MRRLAAIALCLLFTGCLGGSTAPSATFLFGTWVATSVNGSALPFTYPTNKVLTDRTVIIGADGSYSADEHYSDGSRHTEEGAITILGNLVGFTDVTDGINYEAQWSETAMTQRIGGYSIAFRKR